MKNMSATHMNTKSWEVSRLSGTENQKKQDLQEPGVYLVGPVVGKAQKETAKGTTIYQCAVLVGMETAMIEGLDPIPYEVGQEIRAKCSYRVFRDKVTFQV